MAAITSPQSKKRQETEEKDLWSTLLDSVASGKRLPEKTVLVIGGSPETQKDFLETLDSEAASRKPQDRTRRKAPVANEFALGFTYQDVLDADHEDTLARLSIYTLPEPPDAFLPLVKPLLNEKSIPETVLVLLLDWSEPWNWVKQIRDRLRLTQETLRQLDDDAKKAMDETMSDWQQRRRGPVLDGSTQAPGEPSVNVPLGPGEWDEAIGLPLCVVCHGVEKMDMLEKDHTWREEDFDYVLQFLRTIILKHGGSLIYTAGTSPNSLPTLLQSTLGIQSSLKKNTLKHNVVDREKILIPPNWDSWGKIKVIRDGFNVELISDGWSLEVQPHRVVQIQGPDSETNDETAESKQRTPTEIYADNIHDPQADSTLDDDADDDDKLETQTASMQDFLLAQQPVIEQLKQEDEAAAADPKAPAAEGASQADDTGRVNQHIGPVQFNMGGIQVDAEDALQRLRRGRDDTTPEPEGLSTQRSPATTSGAVTPGEDAASNEKLKNFFASLVNKKANAGTPPPPAAGGS